MLNCFIILITSRYTLHITHYTLHITHYTLHITHYTLHLPRAETSHALLTEAVGTTGSDSSLGHLELPVLATTELLDGAANATLLWREHVLLALEDLGVNVVAPRLGTIVKTTVGTTVELAATAADSYECARLW